MTNRPKSSVHDVGAFMASELERSGMLYQEEIVSDIEERFGEEFVYDNESGNRAISKEVLKEFRKLTPNAVWSSTERYWRKRERDDQAGRRQDY